MTTDIRRPLTLGKTEPMPEHLLRHVVARLADRDVLNLSAEMGRRLLSDRDFQAAEVERLRDGLEAMYWAATKVGPGLILTETVATMAENLLAGRAVDHGI